MTANEIRDSFKNFFESKGHLIVPSAPMVIKDAPTLMFTNAGMNQWKDIILGTKAPEPRRRADTQKCLRVSGSKTTCRRWGRHLPPHHVRDEGNWSSATTSRRGHRPMPGVSGRRRAPEPRRLLCDGVRGLAQENIPRDDEGCPYWASTCGRPYHNGNKHNFWDGERHGRPLL
jgi:alanyl-tRNA synthetase